MLPIKSTPKKYSHINFKPTEGMAQEAEKGLEWRKEHGRGGTEVGVARARDIKNRVNLSPDTVKRMKAFFDRHQKKQAGQWLESRRRWVPVSRKDCMAFMGWRLWLHMGKKSG